MNKIEKTYGDNLFLDANDNIALTYERDLLYNDNIKIFLFSHKSNDNYNVDYLTLDKKYFYHFANVETNKYYDQETIQCDRGFFYMDINDNHISHTKPHGEYILFYTPAYIINQFNYNESSDEYRCFVKEMKELGIDDVYVPHIIKGSTIYKFDSKLEGHRYFKTLKSKKHISYTIINKRYVPMVRASKNGKAYGFPGIYTETESAVYNRSKKTLTYVKKKHGYEVTGRNRNIINTTLSALNHLIIPKDKRQSITKIVDYENSWIMGAAFREPIQNITLTEESTFAEKAFYDFVQYMKKELVNKSWQEKHSVIDLYMAKQYPGILMFPKPIIKNIFVSEMTSLNKEAFKKAKSIKELFKMNKLRPLTKTERVLLFSLEDRLNKNNDKCYLDIESIWFIYFAVVRPFAATTDESHKMLKLLISLYNFDPTQFISTSFKANEGFMCAFNSNNKNKKVKKSTITELITELKNFNVNDKIINDVINWSLLPPSYVLDEQYYKKFSKEEQKEYNNLLKELNLYNQIMIDPDNVRFVELDMVKDTVDMMKMTAERLIKSKTILGDVHESVRLVSKLFKDVLKSSTTIVELHDSMVDIINSDSNVFGKENNKFVYTDKELELNKTYGEYSFELPDNTSVLKLIGKQLSICIGATSYAIGSLSREFYLPIVKRNGEIVAVLEVKNNERGLTLTQAKGYHNNINKPLDYEVQEVIINYINDLKIINHSFQDITLIDKKSVHNETGARIMRKGDINVQPYTE